MTDFQTYLNTLNGQMRVALLSEDFRMYGIHILEKNGSGDPLNPNAIWETESVRFNNIEHMDGFNSTQGISHEVIFQNDTSIYVQGDWRGNAWVKTYNDECYDFVNDPGATSQHGTHNTLYNTGHFTTATNASQTGSRSYNDIFHMGNGNDWVEAKTGDDTIHGNGGDDYLDGGTGNDMLYGEYGIDFLFGGDGNDFLDGGTQDDYLSGDAGNDTLHGGDGDDYLTGGDGADSLNGGIGRDYLAGGTGNDTLIGDYGDDSMFGGDDNDSMEGGVGNDLMNGDAGNDSLFGGTGNDTLYGGDGDDNVDGGAGDDALYGNAGNDIFNGDIGSDSMFGGAGDDTFMYTPGFGVDWIVEGAGEAEGTMDMAYIVGTTDAIVLKNGNNLILAFDNDNMIVLNNWYVDQGVEYVYFADADALYLASDIAAMAQEMTSTNGMARSAGSGFDYAMTDLSALDTVSVELAGVTPQLDAAHAMLQ